MSFGAIHLSRFHFVKQRDVMDCGPACLKMVLKHFGRTVSLAHLRQQSYINREGVSLLGIAHAADQYGLRTIAVQIPFSSTESASALNRAPLPAVVHWNQNHFVVLYKLSGKHCWIADPAIGNVRMSHAKFLEHWLQSDNKGIALLLEPSAEFYNSQDLKVEESKLGITLRFIRSYVKPHSKLLAQVLIGLMLASVFQIIFPFLTQAVVDIGIENADIDFIWLVLIGQLALFVGQTSVQFIQSWLLLHVSVRINVSLIMDFLSKLMKLPINYFDTRLTGDILQRIRDHARIETFLTRSSLSMLMSIVNMVIFGAILLLYSTWIFGVFMISSMIYVLWVFAFLKMRRNVDYMAFAEYSKNQDSIIEIINGIAEIKLQGSEFNRLWKWTQIQARLFRVRIKSLSISQAQDAGALSISQLKDIIITFIAAKSVVEGHITLGMMLAIQYIIGQLNTPLQQLVQFMRNAQDAGISLERIGEVHGTQSEHDSKISLSTRIPNGDLNLESVSFRYNELSEDVLQNINLRIPRGKTTAIVGASGSGKTTLIKLLLGFYQPSQGNISIGFQGIHQIDKRQWRANCGVVLQDGYIFSDTIANNISEGHTHTDFDRLQKAIELSNIDEFIRTLPLGINTKVGTSGNGLSQGQRQRMLIARAIYKAPQFIFLDEATNALDAVNENEIMSNLNRIFKNQTVVIVAHRLSTVSHANQIVVLDKGQVAELGNHKDLLSLQGTYYQLVKQQLNI